MYCNLKTNKYNSDMIIHVKNDKYFYKTQYREEYEIRRYGEYFNRNQGYDQGL